MTRNRPEANLKVLFGRYKNCGHELVDNKKGLIQDNL